MDIGVEPAEQFGAMLLRPGADVLTTDGVAARLTDVIVDPISEHLTHLVVTPPGDHQHARLVPLWLVNTSDTGLQVELDLRHLRQLQRVLRTDFVRRPKTAVHGAAEVRFRTILSPPYFVDPESPIDLRVREGIPIDDCSLRRGDDVVSSNDRLLGQIVAFLVRDEHIHAMVVRSGLVGFQNNVVVPIDTIAEILDGMVMLDIDRHQFRRLPKSSIEAVETPPAAGKKRFEQVAASSWFAVRDFVVDLRT